MSRPILRYHGGKHRLAQQIIPYFPPHTVYGEPFGGAFSIGLAKPPSKIQLYNDVCDQTVALMRILRDPVTRDQLLELVALTPYSRTEHARAWEHSDDPIENARRYIVRSFQSVGAKQHGERSGWRTVLKSNSPATLSWKSWPHQIVDVVSALQDVLIECLDWREFFAVYDSRETLFYVDPPYLPATRSARYRKCYIHELTDEDHLDLLDTLKHLKSLVILSGYPHPIYDGSLDGWEVVDFAARAQTNAARTERIWINPSATSARQNLFSEVG